MKKSLILFVALTMTVNLWADSYRDALARYFQLGQVIDQAQYEQMMLPMSQTLFPEDEAKGAAILAEYASQQMMYDLIDIYQPAFQRHVTEAELNQLAATLQDPRILEIQSHTKEIMQTVTNSEEFQDFMGRYQAAVMVILAGGEMPADIDRPAGVSNAYAQAFMAYYQSSGVADILTNAFQARSNMLVETLRRNGTEHPEQYVNKLIQYTDRNLPVVLMSAFYKSLTIADINDLRRLTELPAYSHSIEAVSELVNDPISLGLAVFTRMADWISLHYPQYAVPVQQQVKQMEMILR